MMTSRIGKKYKSIFYSAPMMSGCMVYFNIWQFGVSIFATNEKPSINLINDIILKNNIKMTSLRPSMIDRFILEGADSISNAEIIMTAGAPLTNSQIKYCRDTLNIKHIVDCYATTECGIIAMRDAINEENFELFPAVKIKSFNENGTVIEHSQTIGFWDNKKLKKTSTRFIDDIIELNDNKIKLLGRKSKKIKVNGFSIPSELVRQSVLEISGVSDCKVFASGAKNSSDILNLEYTGKNLNDIDILNSLSEKLPFYCIPQKIKYTPNYYWGLAK
jgi:acyl-coenzyme A synthetase/AMP-(fatty) acid ligase